MTNASEPQTIPVTVAARVTGTHLVGAAGALDPKRLLLTFDGKAPLPLRSATITPLSKKEATKDPSLRPHVNGSPWLRRGLWVGATVAACAVGAGITVPAAYLAKRYVGIQARRLKTVLRALGMKSAPDFFRIVAPSCDILVTCKDPLPLLEFIEQQKPAQ